jgi:ferredoxin--NADP+ reductase
MSHVITQSCCNDAACVPVCPTDCIHPGPHEPGFETADMLYIDPGSCIDCGACIEVCPVDAIRPADELTEHETVFADINARYFEANPSTWSEPPAPVRSMTSRATGPLRVAVVGSGPSALYATEELINQPGLDVEVTVLERLDETGGLARFGVAPDHHRTRAAVRVFRSLLQRDEVTCETGIEVGTDVTHDELLEYHHAVIYAVGAHGSRSLGLPGEMLDGSHSATEFVRWYNGHPNAVDRAFDLSHRRVVVIGNGNVSLDVARMLLKSPAELDLLDIAPHAREALASSRVREVVVLARRGPADGAFTVPELLELSDLSGVDVVVDPEDLRPETLRGQHPAQGRAAFSGDVKTDVVSRYSTATRAHERALVLRFMCSPTAVTGTSSVTGLEVSKNAWTIDEHGARSVEATDVGFTLECGLILRAVGYRGEPVAGLPFDPIRAIVPNSAGRVLDEAGTLLAKTYVTGWIKRGPTGGIGTNKRCAAETVRNLLDDHRASASEGDAIGSARTRTQFEAFLTARRADVAAAVSSRMSSRNSPIC